MGPEIANWQDYVLHVYANNSQWGVAAYPGTSQHNTPYDTLSKYLTGADIKYAYPTWKSVGVLYDEVQEAVDESQKLQYDQPVSAEDYLKEALGG